MRPETCGDNVCNNGEDCLSCEEDCGKCPECGHAPSCTGAIGVPINPTTEGNLCEPGGYAWPGYPDAGVEPPATCGPPKLRFRISKIHAGNVDDKAMYCVVQASDGVQSGVVITNKTGDLADGMEFKFATANGMFWGPTELAETKNNLEITYNCMRVNSDVWSAVLAAAGVAAEQAGGVLGGSGYGWAFGLGGVGLQAAAAAINAASGDDNLLNAQQIIDRNQLLDLANGRSWTIQYKTPKSAKLCGGFFSGYEECDVTITIESWGCADARPNPA